MTWHPNPHVDFTRRVSRAVCKWGGQGLSALSAAVASGSRAHLLTSPQQPPWVDRHGCWCWLGSLMAYASCSLGSTPRFSSPWWTFARLAMLAAVIFAASVILLLAGYRSAALWAAGGPPLLLDGGYGLFALTLVVLGRIARWS